MFLLNFHSFCSLSPSISLASFILSLLLCSFVLVCVRLLVRWSFSSTGEHTVPMNRSSPLNLSTLVDGWPRPATTVQPVVKWRWASWFADGQMIRPWSAVRINSEAHIPAGVRPSGKVRGISCWNSTINLCDQNMERRLHRQLNRSHRAPICRRWIYQHWSTGDHGLQQPCSRL